MSKIIVNFKTDPKTKKELKEFAAELGLPMSAIINAQIKDMLRKRRLVLSTELEPTPYLEKIIKEAEADYAAGRNIYGPFESAQEMIASLEKTSK